MIKVGIVGYGYWGPNIARNFNGCEDVDLKIICDSDPARLKKASATYPKIEVSGDPLTLCKRSDIDIICIITPVFTHFELAKLALENGKHVFVEKPFTATVDQAERLIDLASKKNLKIMVDHTFIYTSAVRKMKEIILNGILGELFYYDSVRVNLGLFQHDINVIWDLAPHDLSILDYLINKKPVAVSAHGKGHFNRGLEDVAYMIVYFDNNLIAHFHVNWLSPVKVRKTLISGSKKMLVWDDMEPSEKIKVYDKGVEIKTTEGIYNLLVQYRAGDMFSPAIDNVEALKLETEIFLDFINNGKPIFNDGQAGLRIVRLLEASSDSLRQNGKLIELKG